MRERMRPLSILFVTVRFPLPLRTGDRARAYHQIRLLATRHRLTLVTFLDEAPSAREARAEIERLGVRVVSVPFRRRAAAWRLLRGLPSSMPLQVALFDAPELREAIHTLAVPGRFDLVHVQLARAIPLLPPDLALPVVADLVDALSLNMARRAARDRGWARWAAALDARRLRAYERAICGRVHAAAVVSAADRDAIDEGPLAIVPNGVDLGEFPYVADDRPPATLIFTGNLGYFPNDDAASWFAREVLPRVAASRPDVRLRIVGARPHRRIRALAVDPRIEVAGDVADMHAALAGATLAVTPMFTGSGQLLKVLEAMASGTPVVANARGLNGIDAGAGVHATIAEDPEAFAAAILARLAPPAPARGPAAGARPRVETQYTWERSTALLEELYASAVPLAAAHCG